MKWQISIETTSAQQKDNSIECLIGSKQHIYPSDNDLLTPVGDIAIFTKFLLLNFLLIIPLLFNFNKRYRINYFEPLRWQTCECVDKLKNNDRGNVTAVIGLVLKYWVPEQLSKVCFH